MIAAPAFIGGFLLHIFSIQRMESSDFVMMLSNSTFVIGVLIVAHGFFSYAIDKFQSKREGN